jgi:hypothetical protein
MFESNVLRLYDESKKEHKKTRWMKKIRNEELHNFYRTTDLLLLFSLLLLLL